MVIDSEAQMIYVSGGRVVDADWELCKYSGLYAYDIQAGSWEALESVHSSIVSVDVTDRLLRSMSDSSVGHPSIPPRFGTLYYFTSY